MKWITQLFAGSKNITRNMSAKEVEQWIYKSDPAWEVCGILATRLALRILPLLFSGEPLLGYGMWYQKMVGSTFRSMAIAHYASMSRSNIVLSLSDKALRDFGAYKIEAHAIQDGQKEEFALSEAKRIHGELTRSNVHEFSETMREARWRFDPHGVIFSTTRYYLSFAVSCFAHSNGDGGRKNTGKPNAQVLLRDLQGNIERQIERSLQALSKTNVSFNINHSDVTSAIFFELTSEIDLVRDGKLNPQDINKLPLWQREMPSLFSSCWQNKTAGLKESEGWHIWFDWFEQRLRGGEPNFDEEKIYARIPIELWKLPPEEMNNFLISRLKSRLLQIKSA